MIKIDSSLRKINEKMEYFAELFIRRKYAVKLSDDSECEICGVTDYDVKIKDIESKINLEKYKCKNCRRLALLLSSSSCSIPLHQGIINVEDHEHCIGSSFHNNRIPISNDGTVMDKKEIVLENVPVKYEVSRSFHTHHTSYKPEKTMTVCEGCHQDIHNTDKYPELVPDDSRSDYPKKYK